MRLAVIPARGGSKRIPRKNIRPFGGQPMIAWSIRAAADGGCFDRIVVSTDDAEIAEVAIRHGAEVPFMRPENWLTITPAPCR
jgi:N-acylneuraminate cytidylyltransferase